MTYRVTLFIPTLNEAEGMRRILPQIKKEWVDQILVVDGKSTDDTVEVAKSFGCEVVVQSRRGLWPAYVEGFQKVRGDIVVTFSPDGNCLPEAIPQLIQKVKEGNDMVVASRYAPGAKSYDDDTMTGFGNWLFTKTINVLHGGKYTDAMGIFRAYRTQLFYELAIDREDAYQPEKWVGTILGIEPLLSVRAAKMKMRVTEIPADEPLRLAGQRKLQVVKWGIAYMLQVFREVYYWRDGLAQPKRPLNEPRESKLSDPPSLQAEA